MNRLFEMLHHPEQFPYGDETVIYFNSENKMIILTHVGEDDDLVQVEGEVDERLKTFIKDLLES